MHAQEDLKTGHSFFQEQYYRLASGFAVYLDRFNSYMIRGISTGITRFNSIVEDVYDDLDEMNAPQECLDSWETYQIRYGRSMATCADYGYDEIEWMVWYYDFLIWWSEYYITNYVQTHAATEFTYWNPLSYPTYDVIGEINNELRYTLDYYQRDYVQYIQYIREYNIGIMDQIIYNVQNCANSLTVSFQATASMFVYNAAAGSC
jgi:hypothetical protein